MSLSIFDRGESRYDLYRGEEAIGWIDGRTIGFDGFESRPAAHADWSAMRNFSKRLLFGLWRFVELSTPFTGRNVGTSL